MTGCFMIASDIHGAAGVTEKLMARFSEEKPEKLILLGDLLYHGPRNALPADYETMKTAALLNAVKEIIIAVRGNCDAEVDQMVLEFPIMEGERRISVDGRTWFLTHGHLYDENSMVKHAPGDVLLHGHTHVKAAVRKDDFYFLNPGSVSMPKDGPAGSYLVYRNGTFTFKDLNGNILDEFKLD